MKLILSVILSFQLASPLHAQSESLQSVGSNITQPCIPDKTECDSHSEEFFLLSQVGVFLLVLGSNIFTIWYNRGK